jgi:hypothetical protein
MRPAVIVHNRIAHRRGGYAAMMSMLFLVLFSSLAVGFYAQTNSSTQMAENDRRIALAQSASESGMDMMRYQLAHIVIPAGTPANQVIGVLATQLGANMNGTRNLGTDVVGLSNNVIYVPADHAHSIKLDAAGQQSFQIVITAWGSDIVVRSTGAFKTTSSGSFGSGLRRCITMDFTAKNIPSTSFDYGVASKGQIVVSKGTVGASAGADGGVASLMSNLAIPSAITVMTTVTGDLNLLAGATATVALGASVGGTTNPVAIVSQHEHTVDAPDFPVVDTSVYTGYAVNAYVPGAPVQQNIVIQPGTNPQFSAGDEVDGVMYVRSPNTVTFRGNFKLKGFIVFESAGDSTVNRLDFRGSVTTSPLPPDSQFDSMRSVSGVAILASTAAVTMSGSADSSIRGNIMVGSLNYSGSATLNVDHGTIMTFNAGPNSAVFNTTKSVLFTATGQTNQPNTGVDYRTYFGPKPSTYQEILP